MDSNVAKSIVDADLEERLATQDWRRTAHFGIPKTNIPAGTTQMLSFDITQEAAFYSDEMTASIFPTNAATRTGLLVQIFDNNTELTDGYIPMENISTPGYGVQLFYPHKFKHIFERNNKVRLNVQNISIEDQEVSITFSGEKLV